MRISHRYKFVFFANPKTASESVRVLLDPYSDVSGTGYAHVTPLFPFYSHMRPVEAGDAFAARGWPFERYYRFTFVRNPWARLASLHRMIRERDPAFRTSFRDWLRSSRPDGTGGGGHDASRWRKYGTYSLTAFAGDGRGTLLVDDVFRMEDIDALPDALRRRGIPLPESAQIPRINIGQSNALRGLYTPELIDLVAERYAEEIARFGYIFPGSSKA